MKMISEEKKEKNMKKKGQNKKIFKRFGATLLCLVLAFSLTGVTSIGQSSQNIKASDRISEITATLSPQLNIIVDGETQTFYNVQGKEVHPVLYSGTTYLPVRAIGELMGKNVNWDQTTHTVTLAGARGTGKVSGTPDSAAVQKKISAEIRRDFTIIVDDTVRSFTDVNGKAVYPLLYEGTTYLPVRAIAELMGKNVQWDGATDTVTLTSGNSGSLVTDADSFNSSNGNSSNNSSNNGSNGSNVNGGTNAGYIGEAKAKEIALKHAGLSSSQVTFVKVQLDYDDGRSEYEVEFYNSASRTEYDYEIDALTGKILSVDYDAEYYTPPSSGSTDSHIGLEKAKSLALSRAGLTASQVTFKKASLDWDDGRAVYEIEFISGNLEHEFEIDALTGSVLDYDRDSRWD